jgi:outer membrane protein assembly factor BamE (lipoprotein component of BamABCDE complex)
MTRALTLVLLCLGLCGCASVNKEITYDYGAKNLTQENMNKIVKGKTTKQEVLALLGNPTMRQTSSWGETWTYTRSITKQKFNWITGLSYDPEASKTSSLTVTFDEKGIVKDINTFEMGTMMTGTVEVK